jgi:hypothetical protein
MEKEFTHGRMEGNMKEIIKMTKKKGLVSMYGLTEEGMKVVGKMVNNMEKENTSYQMEMLNTDFGTVGNVSNGWRADLQLANLPLKTLSLVTIKVSLQALFNQFKRNLVFLTFNFNTYHYFFPFFFGSGVFFLELTGGLACAGGPAG